MLLRLVLMLCLALQPAMGWARPALEGPPTECVPPESCCPVEMAARDGCQPCRPCNPGPSRPACGVDSPRVLSNGPRLERAPGREVPEPYRGPAARSRPAAMRPARAERPARPGQARRPFLCVWVI